MPRYLTQDLFDVMATSQSIARLRSSQSLNQMFADTVKRYKRSYPDEDFDAMLQDLKVASKNVDKIATQIYEELFEQQRPDRESVYFSILKRLSEIVVKEARSKQSLLKRIFGGTYFNYESSLLPDRVEKCRENVSLAGMMILVSARAQ